MLRADEDSRLPMFSHHNEFLLYIFSNANGIEKLVTSFNSITRSTCCNVRLNIMIKQ